MNIKQHLKNYSTMSLLLLFTSFFLIFAIKPSVELIFSLFHEKSELINIDASLEAKIQNIIKAQNTYMSLADNIDVLDKALPARIHITDIQQLLASSSATLDTFSIEKQAILPLTKGVVTAIAITTSTEAEYSQIKKFVRFILQKPRIFTLEKLSLFPSEGTQSAQLKTPMVINTYFYAPL